MLRCLVAVIAIAVVAFAAPAAAQQCRPLDLIVEQLKAHPLFASMHVASPAETKIAVEIYNAMPPEGDDKFDGAILMSASNGGGVAIFIRDGLACGGVPMPPSQWRAFIRTVRGEAS